LTASDAGSNATISIASFTLRTSSKGDVSVNSGSVTALSYSTLYYVYYDDATLAGGGVTYAATTTKETAINGAGRFFVGSIVTPAATAPNTTGNSDGGIGAQAGSNSVFLGGSSTTVLNPTGTTITNIQNFFDGSTTTFGSLATTNASSSSRSAQITAQGMSPTSAPWSSLVLNVRTSVTANPANCNAQLEYSLDGGSTYTTIYNLSATTRALTTDQITLANNQNLALIKIRATVQCTTGTNVVTQNLYEFWVVGLV
jgi:hypothetical protein